MVTAPPLSGVTTLVAKVLVLYSTTPPLANLAYSADALEGGSLVGVLPRPTTFMEGASGGMGGVAVTRLVAWVPVKGGTYDASWASRQVSSSLGAGFVTGSRTGQGPGSTMCYGRGPCSEGVGKGVLVRFVGAALVVGLRWNFSYCRSMALIWKNTLLLRRPEDLHSGTSIGGQPIFRPLYDHRATLSPEMGLYHTEILRAQRVVQAVKRKTSGSCFYLFDYSNTLRHHCRKIRPLDLPEMFLDVGYVTWLLRISNT